jgi:hypothetical protein
MVPAMHKLALMAVVASSCTRPPLPHQPTFRYGEIRGQLQRNGLRFVVVSDTTTPLVEVDVRYEVGAREDPSGKAGLAHLVEHLMFEQRPDRGRDKDDVQDFEPSEAQRALEVPAAPTALAGRGPVRARQRHACRSPAGRRDAAGGGRPDVRRRPCLGAPRAWRSQGRRPS